MLLLSLLFVGKNNVGLGKGRGGLERSSSPRQNWNTSKL
jgi:hypothetical protein